MGFYRRPFRHFRIGRRRSERFDQRRLADVAAPAVRCERRLDSPGNALDRRPRRGEGRNALPRLKPGIWGLRGLLLACARALPAPRPSLQEPPMPTPFEAIARIGVVLGPDGGMVQRMRGPFKAFIGGPLASGKQMVSWVHWKDVVRAMVFALDTKALSGPFNVTAPRPVTMSELSHAFGRVLGRPSFMRVPEAALAAVVGKDLARLIATGQRAVPRRLLHEGFRFDFDDVVAALRDVLS